MQAGHYAVALTIASFAEPLTGGHIGNFSLEAMAVTVAATTIPNLDGIPIMLKLAPKAFHCTWSHTVLFPVLVGLIMLALSAVTPLHWGWASLVFVSMIVHLLSDMPSSVGLPLFMPFTKKRFTFNLWADTGVYGWISFRGTYEQAWTWILEGGSYLILLIRLYQCNVFPFR